MDSNHRMSESKSDALPTWRNPCICLVLRAGLEPALPKKADFKSAAATYYAIGAIVSLQTLACVFKELLLSHQQHDSSIAYLDLIVNQ